MRNRILKILNNEKLSATKFADIIGVQRSSISHIISGRNKPSFDFISKTINKFPYINAEWLINGKGNMYKDDNKTKESRGEEPELFKEDEKLKEERYKQKQVIKTDSGDPADNMNEREFIIKRKVTDVNNIEKVIILYSNGTFREYSKTE
ncbi:MAG: helix-turn-helix transcriptional regulator [Bacteroidales bacterium]|nr:MAG: helix-turn-helix transcriptional regulator [Bacteroidales bacterium]